MKTQRQRTDVVYQSCLKVILLLVVLMGSRAAFAQCPPNLDFEEGTFNNWQCWSGSFTAGGINVTLTTPTAGRHDMLSVPPGNGRDLYGNFTKNSPNGSGHSIKIGNENTGTTADKVSYTFTIPAGQNTFNLIYHYALVLNDAGHTPDQQPRLIVSVLNLTDNTPLPCPLPPIVVGGGLPGFFDSQVRAPNGSLVRCKPWAAASMKLDNLAGKTIEVSFTITGCNLTNGSHFGYAYIDLNSECSSSFIGATYCPDDAFIDVTGPYGYETYTWWDATFTTILGTTQTINFTPPPPPGTNLKLVMTPYAGYGCIDTLTAILQDTLTIQPQAGPDQLSCNNAPVQLGANPQPTYVYSWSPTTGLSDPNISNPIATPSVTTQYVLTVRTAGGGCVTRDTVIVSAAVLDTTLQITGPVTGCVDGSQPTILNVLPADSIQWYENNIAIPGANQTQYIVLQSGTYHATLFSFVGCRLSTSVVTINLNPQPVAGFNINANDQCFKNHQFVFTNTSTIVSGTMLFNWDLGDGTSATTQDVTHSYSQSGTYLVKLIVTSDKGCIDSASFTVKVFASPVAGFNQNATELCINNHQFVFTNTSTVSTGTMQYNWDMGDGTVLTGRDVTYSYTLLGAYIVRLLVTTDNGCADSSIINVSVNPSPVAGFTVNTAQQCFANNLFNFTNSTVLSSGTLQYLWDLGDGTTATTPDVNHSYAQAGNFVVKMIATSDKGCVDSTSSNVLIFPFSTSDFYVAPVCTNITLPLINKTIDIVPPVLNYLWDFGNGQTSTLRNPVYSYPSPGTYTISLGVSTSQCPLTYTIKQQVVVINAPAPGITYPDKDAVMNFPEPLHARQIGNTVLWSPATGLDNRYAYSPKFRGINPQLYTIELKTPTGCITVDTLLVKTHKKIEIYVPTVFTPGSSTGLNDYLRPVLMGFDHVNYFRIYNRWGKMIFQMQSDQPGWDGKVNGVLQEMQTVVWMIEAVDIDGKIYQRQGTTVLMR